MPSATLLGQSVLSGVFIGALYGLLGLGLSLSWGMLRQVNLAHFALAFLGGYLTFRLSKKGGKEGMEKKFGKARVEKVYKEFEKGGFSTIAIGSIIPPPFPLVPVLMAAGIMQYAKKKFLAALTLGRGIRFFAIAALGKLYGTAILGWLGRYYKPFLYVLIALGVLGGLAALWYFKWYRPRHQPASKEQTKAA